MKKILLWLALLSSAGATELLLTNGNAYPYWFFSGGRYWYCPVNGVVLVNVPPLQSGTAIYLDDPLGTEVYYDPVDWLVPAGHMAHVYVYRDGSYGAWEEESVVTGADESDYPEVFGWGFVLGGTVLLTRAGLRWFKRAGTESHD